MAMEIQVFIFLLLLLIFLLPFSPISAADRRLIQLEDGDGPNDDVVWIVQLSDLHFSVHHPDRAEDFREIVGPTLSFVNPSLVFLTGDLTDGKSKDLLVMKQDEKEWVEYENVLNEVIKRSGLEKASFYDIRGNHDKFGVPLVGDSFDFYSKYSINGQLQRNGSVNSITVQSSKLKLLFVGFDSTMFTGLRGPTNLFGHPTDELLEDINSELSQWDSEAAQPITKITFGHFPLSFSAASESGKTLKDVFIAHSVDAYLCGHLHTKFGKNLKRHHYCQNLAMCSKQLFQLNGHRIISGSASGCSNDASRLKEFWEWEMGDWRRSRAMRILAIDRGYVSFVDLDFKDGPKKTIVLPTFPLDSRLTSAASESFKCDTADPSSYGTIRALVFSASPIVSVMAKIYDSKPGRLVVVFETPMTKFKGSRGDVYTALWNAQAFEDPSPDRFLLEIVATDTMGRSTASALRPFSVTGIPSMVSWTWKEFLVMGCQWDSLYNPILWFFYLLVLSTLLLPKLFLSFSTKQYTFRNLKANPNTINGLGWIFVELYNFPIVLYGLIGYLFYLLLCPWFYGKVFTEGPDRGYMTFKGWVLRLNDLGRLEFLGSPDVMVVVLMHLFLVVLPSIMIIVAFIVESGMHQYFLLSLSRKKNDDYNGEDATMPASNNDSNNGTLQIIQQWRGFRKLLLVATMPTLFKHFMSCIALVKAYEMNPVIHFPVYSFAIPLLVGYAIWKTGKDFNGISKR